MKQKTVTLILILSLLRITAAHAGEGMWIPMLLEKYNIEDMKEKGFKLEAEDIYAVNQASMKDAVMIFNGGCTAELISDEGLILTNHHCGEGAIQSHSSVENDYLANGYWAMSRDEELPNPGMYVKFLVRMEDVTEQALKGVTKDMNELERERTVEDNIAQIRAEATEGTDYSASVEPFYFGNQYILFVNKTYNDIRFVGAPPSSIGSFGGDTDNWMWPRHTGDFSLFRIYANEDNEPAEYNKDNVPFQPKTHFDISLNGYEKGDFTMVFGYPASTHQYYTRPALNMHVFEEYPIRIGIRSEKLDILDKAMKSDPKIRIQYASKQSRISNSWKKWKGILHGLRRANVMRKKEQMGEDFWSWTEENPGRSDRYGDLYEEFYDIYEDMSFHNLFDAYMRECFFSLDPLRFARRFLKLNSYEQAGKKKQGQMTQSLIKQANNFYKDYHKPTDRKIFARMMKLFADSAHSSVRPGPINEALDKYDEGMKGYTRYVYNNSILLNKDSLINALKRGRQKHIDEILADPLIKLYISVIDLYRKEVAAPLSKYNRKIDSLNRIWIRGLKEMHQDKDFIKKKNEELAKYYDEDEVELLDTGKTFWPDANFTLRVAYGKVNGYKVHDAVSYKYYTTMEGIMQKHDPGNSDYKVPDKLISLYEDKDFGRYAEDGEMHVCFIASNHTSGGNSGSPVIDANGNLIGLNFDRNWEGTMSDFFYDPSQCRNISVDIRYVLFVIDKYANAGHLIDEMDLVQ